MSHTDFSAPASKRRTKIRRAELSSRGPLSDRTAESVADAIGELMGGDVSRFLAAEHPLHAAGGGASESVTSPVLTVIRRLSPQARSPRGTIARKAIARLKAKPLINVREREVAAELTVSPSHLGRVLKEETGLGFREWRLVLVMDGAVRALILSAEQVAQIAYRFGYEPSNVSQFTADCRRLLGVGPRDLRRLIKPTWT